MISVVVPVLNEEELLSDCLRSLIDQNYDGEYEIIVADNGSTDNTSGIARELGVKVVSCPEPKNVFYARQVGADAARGDIIAQADADTVYPHDWLKRIDEQFASHPEAVALAGRFFYRDRFTLSKVEYFLRQLVNRLSVVLFGKPFVVSGASLAFRRKAFLTCNGYRDLSYSADQYGISEQLSKLGKVLYDKDLYCLTSARSVQKPTYILILAFLANIIRWGNYLCASRVSVLKEFPRRIPGISLSILLHRINKEYLAISIVSVMSVAFVGYGYFIPSSSAFGRVYAEGKSSEKVVALTFDDGPNDPYTSQIIDILAAYDIKATFFLIGENVQLYPETARRIRSEGHVIGNHSYSHIANHALTNYGAKDLRKAQVVISNIIGVTPHLYRPPHGKKSPWELQAVKKEGMSEVMWSVSANDQHVLAFFGKPTPEAFAREIVRETDPGEIVLLHDGYGVAHDTPKSDKSLTVESLPLIIEQLQAEGYRFVTVDQLLNIPAYNSVSP